MGQCHVTRPRSFSPGSSWQEKPKSVSLMFMLSSKRMFSGFRSRCTMLSLCKLRITSSKALMIFLEWDRHMLLLYPPLRDQATSRETEAHIPTRLPVREDSRQAGGRLPKPAVYTPSPDSCKLCPFQDPGGGTTRALGQEMAMGADGSLPGFLLTQSDLLSEVIKELPSLHPVGTECSCIGPKATPSLSCSQRPVSYHHISRGNWATMKGKAGGVSERLCRKIRRAGDAEGVGWHQCEGPPVCGSDSMDWDLSG